MANLESAILARELGRLGGIGARWAARFLPSVSHDSTFFVNASTAVVGQRVDGFLREFGRPIPEFPCNPEQGKHSAIVGSGHLNLNPTIVHVQINETNGAASVSVRALVKEGKIKQQTAQRLVERIEHLLRLASS
jgi:hypothetical protein